MPDRAFSPFDPIDLAPLDAILAEEEAAGNTEDGWWDQVRGIELVNTRRLTDPAALREAIGLPPLPRP